MNTTVTNKKLEIDDYKLHRLDRLYKKGGGVCAYFRKNIKSSVIKELTQISDTSFHQLWINLQYKKTKSLLACVCYRPPDCPLDCFENSLKPQYIHALSMRKPIIILGDLNCNMLNTTSRECKSLTEMTSELNLKKIIESPTRITDISQSLIDVILVSSPNTVCDSGVLNCTISDHLPVYVMLKLKPTKHHPPSLQFAAIGTTTPNYLPLISHLNLNAFFPSFFRLFSIFFRSMILMKNSKFSMTYFRPPSILMPQ